nr:increased DNA methylation 1-like [Tanacetum cinerariifolium]
MDIIKKKMKESAEDSIANLDVNWILLRGKAASEEDKAQLKDAVDIFHNLFKPIIDPVTRSDFIESMAYGMEMGGSTMNGSDFSGVYCALLTINSKAVTAGLFRVFGRNIAELSIVATSKSYQRKRNEYRRTHTSMVEFRGTSLLEKEVPKGLITFEDCQLQS